MIVLSNQTLWLSPTTNEERLKNVPVPPQHQIFNLEQHSAIDQGMLIMKTTLTIKAFAKGREGAGLSAEALNYFQFEDCTTEVSWGTVLKWLSESCDYNEAAEVMLKVELRGARVSLVRMGRGIWGILNNYTILSRLMEGVNKGRRGGQKLPVPWLFSWSAEDTI